MPYIIGVAKNESELYERFKAFISGAGNIGNVEYFGVGDGKLIDLHVSPQYVYQDFTVTCVTEEDYGGTFSVVGSTSGVLPDAVVNEVYTNSQIQFYLDTGMSRFKLGDRFVIKGGSTNVSNLPAPVKMVGGKAAVNEDITISCTQAGTAEVVGVSAYSPARFIVTGSQSGALGSVGQGEAFIHDVVNFLIPESSRTDPSKQFSAGKEFKVHMAVNPLKAVGQHWDILRTETSPQTEQFGEDVTGTDSHLILKGKGLDGTDEIFSGIHRYWDSSKGWAAWDLSGFKAYIPTLSHVEQPGNIIDITNPKHKFPAFHMWEEQIPYWIFASGRRYIIAVDSNQYDMMMYQGFYLPYQTPKENPYPMMVGGSTVSGEYGEKASTNHMWASNFWFPRTDDRDTVDKSSLRILKPDGVSLGFCSQDNNSLEIVPENYACSWPEQFTWPYAPQGMRQLRENLDGTVPLIRCCLYSSWGEMDGVYATTGYNQQSGNMVIQGGKKYVVFASVFRTGREDYCAVEMK